MKRIVLYSLIIAILVTLAIPTVNTAFAQGVNASLTVTKTGTPLTQSAPGTITWNVTITNTGDVTLTGINVTDSRHGALGSFGSLTPGSTGWFTTVESDLPSGTYTDQAFAAGWYGPENLTVIAFSDLVECVVTPPNASISLSKTPSATKVVVGSSVSYLYNVTNTGETALTGGIYDDVFGPVGNYVNLQPGGWVGFNITHVITANTTNVATAYGVDSFGQNVTASATAFVQVLQPTISVDKTGDPKHQFAPGTITWNVTITNTGDVTLTGINVTDTRHGYLGSAGTLNPGQTIFFVIVETDLPPGFYCDTATAVGAFAGGIVRDGDDATCVVLPECIMKLIPDVDVDIECLPDGIAAEINVTFMNSTHLTVSALKSGSCIDYSVTYDDETDLNDVSDSIDSHDLAQTQLLLTDAECSTSWSEAPPSETPSCQDNISDNIVSDSVASYSSTWSAPPLGVQQQSTLLDENCRFEGISPSNNIGEFGVIQGALLALLITPGTSPWWATALLSIQRSVKKYMM